MAGEPSFVEIGVRDQDKARAFYEKLFGWDYTMLSSGAVIDMTDRAGAGAQAPTAGAVKVGGGMHVDTDPPMVYVYFAVADLEESIATVRELGGTVAPLRRAAPELGRFAQCHDDQGIAFGLHQRAPLAT
jgi:predicted enzyme related to lactoylglutathione lyase